jgi:hypothetical protein
MTLNTFHHAGVSKLNVTQRCATPERNSRRH